MGLPDETIDDVRDTLKRISELKPDNLTIHSLAIKRAANLNIEMEQYKSHDMGATEEMLDAAYKTAADMNLVPYYLYRQKNIPGNFENVGFARVGTEGLYNILMMEEKQTVLALGAGTVSKRVFKEGGRIERIDNVKALDQYIDRIDEMIERKRKLLEGD
jgi:oxygen-independent coproporphyrinogen-3 oxidase